MNQICEENFPFAEDHDIGHQLGMIPEVLDPENLFGAIG